MTFQILWIIAGAICGWIGMDIVVIFAKRELEIPSSFNAGMAFVGGLIAYTLTR